MLQVDSEPLQLVADQIVECFVKHGKYWCNSNLTLYVLTIMSIGLMPRPRDSVKMHVTLINTLFRDNSADYFGSNDTDQLSKSAATQSGTTSKPRRSFDGRDILRQYATYDFGKQPVTEVHISRRYTTNCVGGFYDASAVVKVY